MRAIAVLAAVAATSAHADEDKPSGRRASDASKPSWEFGITAYPTFVRGGDNYTSAIAVADRGPLHLEARYNYESHGARSAFVGWTFSGGDSITWELTPLLGGAWGSVHAFVPGLEASLGWRQFDFYIEGEYVRDNARTLQQLLVRVERVGISSRSSGCASESPVNARARTAAIATSSAGHSHS